MPFSYDLLVLISNGFLDRETPQESPPVDSDTGHREPNFSSYFKKCPIHQTQENVLSVKVISPSLLATLVTVITFCRITMIKTTFLEHTIVLLAVLNLSRSVLHGTNIVVKNNNRYPPSFC